MVYEDLKNQFNLLDDKTKCAFLVYKSKLGLLINDLDNNPLFEKYYDYVKKINSNPINLLSNKIIFKYLDFTSIDTFKKSLYETKSILDNSLDKLILKEDITTYRIVSTNDEINDISKSNIISSSLSFAESFKFANNGKNITIYKLNIKKGSHVSIIPYAIKYDENNNRLILTTSSDQNEIILNKDLYTFSEISNEYKDFINYVEINLIENKLKL